MKLRVYRAVVLTSLLYGCATWTLDCRHVKQMENVCMCALHSILGIYWQDHITNVEVLDHVECTSFEAILIKAKLRWAENVVRMDDHGMPRQLLYGELEASKKKQG